MLLKIYYFAGEIFFNCALNVYPIMVQRYNRARLLRFLDRL